MEIKPSTPFSSETESPSASSGAQPELFIDDDDRYSRLRLIGWWDQEKIANASVLVVGAGALGNEVIKNLALLGLGQIYVVDMDEIQESNLTRSVLFRSHHKGMSKAVVAAEMARELNSDCNLIPLHGNVLTDIGLGLVRSVDLVICCVDNREARLWINRMCWKVTTPWIDGGIQEINGVAKVFVPPHGSCYECAMTENDYRLISLRYSCPLLKQEDIQRGRVPTAPTIASIIGGLQVQEALKLIHEMPTAEGSAMVFNGVVNNFYKTRFQRREDCMSHETYENITSIRGVTHEAKLADFFQAVASQFEVPLSELTLVLDRDFLIRLECRACQKDVIVDEPLCKVGATRGVCGTCSQPLQPVTTCEISAGLESSDWSDRSLADLGIPDNDIVSVVTEDQAFHLQLTGSRDSSRIGSGER
ncbi:MAG: ThiF family adenylyltransferase [Planctomycetota bacterium]